MTLAEFNIEFDVIYENISKGGAPGLIPYEKSVILTQAAEMLALEIAAEDLSLVANLVQTVQFFPSGETFDKLDQRSVIFSLPDNSLKILNELIYDNHGSAYVVIPLKAAEYAMMMSKPYRYPRRRTVWRLENSDLLNQSVEILARPETTMESYYVRYLTLPSPIILENLTGGLTIRGLAVENETNIISSLHPKILNVATQLAEQYYLDKYPQANGTQNNQ